MSMTPLFATVSMSGFDVTTCVRHDPLTFSPTHVPSGRPWVSPEGDTSPILVCWHEYPRVVRGGLLPSCGFRGKGMIAPARS